MWLISLKTNFNICLFDLHRTLFCHKGELNGYSETPLTLHNTTNKLTTIWTDSGKIIDEIGMMKFSIINTKVTGQVGDTRTQNITKIILIAS